MTLGGDLLLLAVDGERHTVVSADRIDFALMGTDLVELAIAGRVTVVRHRIQVVSAAPVGDPLLDAALASIAGARRPPRATDWVRHVRRGIREDYLERLAREGAVRLDERRVLGFVRVREVYLVDAERQHGLRERVDRIAASDGPFDHHDRALAGLVNAADLHRHLYPGWSNRGLRKRLERAGRGDAAARAAGQAADSAHASASGALDAATGAATLAATDAATQAAIDAATAAATQAAIDAATSAATQAAIDAATSAAADAAGHSSHGGHGDH
jgi:hypothetical protein